LFTMRRLKAIAAGTMLALVCLLGFWLWQ